ncbi:MAG TPA: NAD(P)-dependent oxidoreductase [Nitrospirota bacterium]|nr:NAD(P)-dependent oxidoreductase [Nitrospirota bacterium]
MKIAVLGLGIIGSAWSKNLIDDGHDVRCWNRTPKDIPRFHANILDAVDGAEVVFIVVADPPAVQSVLDQIKPKLGAGMLVIQSSTISAKWTLQFAEEVKKTGASYLEAPFTGSKIAAAQRQTVYYLGGGADVVERGRAVLGPISSAILHIGPVGTASTLKLAMNMNIAAVAQALCESLAMSRSAGIPDDIYFKALARNASHSPLADLKEPKLRQHDYSPQFSIKHMAKDLRLALETAAELPVSFEQTANLKKIYDRGMETGWAEDDFIGLMRFVEKKV